MIYEYLLTGEQNARTGKELAEMLNLAPRDISQAVERERREGRPICATCNAAAPGYFIAETQEEMQRYCDRLHHRAGEIYKTRAACLKTMEALPAKGAGRDV